MSDVVQRARTMVRTIEYAQAQDVAQAYPDSTVAQLVAELADEVERLRSELALLRGGINVRPMTEVESNLMTQVLDLRRQLATRRTEADR